MVRTSEAVNLARFDRLCMNAYPSSDEQPPGFCRRWIRSSLRGGGERVGPSLTGMAVSTHGPSYDGPALPPRWAHRTMQPSLEEDLQQNNDQREEGHALDE